MAKFGTVCNPTLETYGRIVEIIRDHPDNTHRFYPMVLVEFGSGRRRWMRRQNISEDR